MRTTKGKPGSVPSSVTDTRLTCIELCAGAGGQAIGLDDAGFRHLALVEIDKHACATLRANRDSAWADIVYETDLAHFNAMDFEGVDLVSAGVPCPPFSRAGAQLGEADERNLFPRAIEIAKQCNPKAIMFENVRGFLDAAFKSYRDRIEAQLDGYVLKWDIVNACDFGVPQLRPRVVGVALKRDIAKCFEWPAPQSAPAPTVGEALYELMASRGWQKAAEWRDTANRIAPTLVGGSKKHGGADLGPTRAKQAWARLGVNALVLDNAPPDKDFEGMPKLTVEMAARLQGFPPDWKFAGGKTAAYRQVGNAFPPPVAAAFGRAIKAAIEAHSRAESQPKNRTGADQLLTVQSAV